MWKEEMVWRMALSRTRGIGPVHTKKLIAVFGDAASVFRASGSQLLSAGLSGEMAQAIREFNGRAKLEAEAELLIKDGIRTLYFTEPEYPRRLLSFPEMPPLLYYRGNADLNAKRILAVVGTRKPDAHVLPLTKQLIEQLQPAGPLIISGLAYGIDGAAHQAALDTGLPTVGVLANGLSMVYPPEHGTMARKMIVKGGLLTSFPYGEKAQYYKFPIRNPLVAGLCDALLVVQSGVDGGSMLTVAHARKFGKKIFAVPGRLTDSKSEGCNRLIQQGVARLLTSGQQLAAEMGWSWPQGGSGAQASLSFGDAPHGSAGREHSRPEERLLKLINEKVNPGLDELAASSDLDASTIALALLELELRGAITVLPGKRYAGRLADEPLSAAAATTAG